MSKIFEAYKKKAGGLTDLSLAIGRAGATSLYPVPSGPQLQDFSKLASRLLSLRVNTTGMVLGFGSSAHGEGGSYVSYNTALFLAETYKQKVVWIDGNFESSQSKLRGQEGLNFSALLNNPDLVGDLVAAENPLLLPSGNDLRQSRGLFASDNYRRLLARLSQEFDFIIVDMPPVLGSTDTALMAAGVDGFLLVIEQKNLKTEVIEHGLESLESKGVNLLGSVINRRTFDLPKIIYDRL